MTEFEYALENYEFKGPFHTDRVFVDHIILPAKSIYPQDTLTDVFSSLLIRIDNLVDKNKQLAP